MIHTNSSDFNVSPSPASTEVSRVFRCVRLYAFMVLIFFAISCKAANSPEEDETSDVAPRSLTNITETAGFSARYGHAAAVFGNALWVIGGYNNTTRFNDVYKSTDGNTWSQVTTSGTVFTARSGHTVAVFNNALWVIGGYNNTTRFNDVYKSTDGNTWSQVTTSGTVFTARTGHTAAVFKGALWVIGGDTGSGIVNDVYKSTDGSSWTLVTANAGFSARDSHTTAVFNDGSGEALWVIGGWSGSINNNNVYKSTDGSGWVAVTANAGFSARSGHTTAVFNDGSGEALWVIGGWSGSKNNDVWKSTNGIDWTSVTTGAVDFPGRNGHTTVVFDSALWTMGGDSGSSGIKNDVWKY
ncbi:hypothetical protein CHS0354_035223 [Potamilus streckersoni]|uniref:Galactose oxidase n=1 Tax=Potamilus streckersoni TaxID=2493646 RepID=A0AAE0VMX0_9BIVA|nr:hypothetical protein CHS0354_035223 [Potamilus streckersoni]